METQRKRYRNHSLQSRRSLLVLFALALLLTPLPGCGGDDDGGDSKPVAGTFVGKAQGTKAFVAVVASPPREGQDRRDVTVYVYDARRICELFSGSASGDDFEASSDNRDAQANGKLSAKAVTGTIELADRKPIRYRASQATATARSIRLDRLVQWKTPWRLGRRRRPHG
jgi:hypothetical protein